MAQDNTGQPVHKIRVVIVDDHQIFRQGVQVNLELNDDIEVVGQAATGEQGLEVVRSQQPDVVVLDINLPIMNGIQVTRQLITEGQKVRIVMLTAYDDTQQMIYALRAGAAAYCVKEINPQQLVDVIRFVSQGRFVVGDQVFDKAGLDAWVGRGVQAAAGQYYADMSETFSPLSAREMEILQCVTRGLSNKEIARTLKISHQTVKNHMTAILRKLAVEDRTQAAVFALREGWVRLQDTDDERSEGNQEA
jgi:DNA-binding NarL/FixJ family response regulator